LVECSITGKLPSTDARLSADIFLAPGCVWKA
jgi:hypothetical protein